MWRQAPRCQEGRAARRVAAWAAGRAASRGPLGFQAPRRRTERVAAARRARLARRRAQARWASARGHREWAPDRAVEWGWKVGRRAAGCLPDWSGARSVEGQWADRTLRL